MENALSVRLYLPYKLLGRHCGKLIVGWLGYDVPKDLAQQIRHLGLKVQLAVVLQGQDHRVLTHRKGMGPNRLRTSSVQ